MPENEFELYLSLLSRFLRLNPAQQGEIADELRDHLEQRLEELSARGLSREQAIHTALEEFGDAAELAQHFTRAAHSRRRKLIMRYTTYGTAAVLAAGLLIAAAFWPETNSGPLPIPNRALAQVAGGGGGPMPPAGPGGAIPADDEEARNAALETSLRKPIDVNFQESTLEDALIYLQDVSAVQLIIDKIAITEADRTLTRPVTLHLQQVQARTALELILEWGNLGYSIRDGILVITTAERAHEIRVYNVRDLLPVDAEGGGGSLAGGPGMPAGGMGMPPGMGAAMGSMMGSGGAGKHGAGMMGAGIAPPMGGMGARAGIPVVHQTTSLAKVIAATVSPDSWDDMGGAGSIIEYNGLLVVKNSHAVHGKVRRLLDTMRLSLHQPGGMTPGSMGAAGGFMGGWGAVPGASGPRGNPGQ